MHPSDSLWHVCETVYFPRVLRIRHPHTRDQYRYAINDLSEALGQPATVADLSDDNVTLMMRHLRDVRKLAARTVNERRGRINALWSWLARRGYVRDWPTTGKIPEPVRTPQAWTQEQLAALFEQAAKEEWSIGMIPGQRWWPALLGVAWNTSERIGAVLQLRWEWLTNGVLVVPAEARKGARRDAVYHLWPETMELLEAIRRPPRQLIFHWPYSPSGFYARWKAMLKRAGLPTGRKSGPHRLRVSHATWVRILSGEHASSLGHANSETTQRYYEDPRLIVESPKLFVPWRA